MIAGNHLRGEPHVESAGGFETLRRKEQLHGRIRGHESRGERQEDRSEKRAEHHLGIKVTRALRRSGGNLAELDHR